MHLNVSNSWCARERSIPMTLRVAALELQWKIKQHVAGLFSPQYSTNSKLCFSFIKGCWAADPDPGLGCCAEKRELTEESHLDRVIWWLRRPPCCLRWDPAHPFLQGCVKRDVVWVWPEMELACREHWGWHTLPTFVLVRVENQHSKEKVVCANGGAMIDIMMYHTEIIIIKKQACP